MTVDKTTAKAIALKYLEEYEQRLVNKKALSLSREPLETWYGWVFFYNTQRFIETGNISYALGGNSPFIVLKKNGEIVRTSSAYTLEDSLKNIEKRITDGDI